ncbi:uncharacterized protein LOC129267008 isoform X1 [Lytechinus pictus]|uniref:uncharacterized protein LOC129267008 isoform X1 n=1 Tax=Lytechinus pictus TaxID=7653 RepID=UPI0030B9CFBC
MATEPVFRAQHILDCIPINHKEDLQAIFTREGLLKRTIHSVWGCPGHLFISLDGGTLVRAYQLKSPNRIKQFTILAKVSPVIKICFIQDMHDVILVFYKNGLVKVYEHVQPADSNSQPWRKREQFSLGTTNDACVKSAICCFTQGKRVVVWVEERKEATSSGSAVEQCLLTAELEPNCKGIKSPVLLLFGCQSELQLAADYNGEHITILPSQPCPAGMYFRLHFNSTDRSPLLESSILGEGCVERYKNFPVDFSENADSLIHIWSEVAKHSFGKLVAMTMEARTGMVFLISEDGSVHSISCAGEEKVGVFHLSDVDASSVSDWFAVRFVIGAVFPQDRIIRLYSSVSGDILQEINLSSITSADAIRVWSILGSLPQIGFWSSTGIWLLQMQEASIAARADEPNTTHHLLDFELNKMAAATELQKLYSELTEEGAVASETDLDLLADSNVFQNEALLVSLSQDVDRCKHPRLMEKVANLQQRFKERPDPTPDTALNESMLPLLKDFYETREQRDKLEMGEIKSSGGLTLSSQIKEALDMTSVIPPGLRLSKLELLSNLYPEKLLEGLIKELDLEQAMESGVNGEEERPTEVLKHWSLCNPETEEGARFLKIVCRLLYIHQPLKLVDVVKFFQELHNTASDLSAFTRKRHGLSVSGMVLDVLPDPTESSDTKEAIRAKAQLIQDSDKSHGPMKALQLLLSHSLWEDAVHVVEGHMPQDSQSHRELFYVLLCAMLMDSSALQEHSQRLWDCLPPSISALNLLQALQINQDSVKNQLQRDSPRQTIQGPGLTTALLKEQLIQMLAHESV